MKELPIHLRLRLEELMNEFISARTLTAFTLLQMKAIKLRNEIETHYASQQ